MLRSIERRKCFEFVERALLLKHLGVGRERHRRIEDTRHAIDRNLARKRMRRGIGAEEIAGAPEVAALRNAARSSAVLITGIAYIIGFNPAPSQSVRVRFR